MNIIKFVKKNRKKIGITMLLLFLFSVLAFVIAVGVKIVGWVYMALIILLTLYLIAAVILIGDP